MKKTLKSLMFSLLIVSIAFSSIGTYPVSASQPETHKEEVHQYAIGTVIIGVATVVAALPVVVTAWDALTCRYETANVRTAISSYTTYGTTNYYNSRASYSYTSPAKSFYVMRDTRMDGVLNQGLNSAIKSKTSVDVLSGVKVVPSKSYTFYTNRSLKYAYAKATMTKYTFDVYKKCGFWSNKLVLGSTWFIAPSTTSAYYVYYY